MAKNFSAPEQEKSSAVEQKSFGGCAYPKSLWQHAACESFSSPSITPENISFFSDIPAERLLKALKEGKTAKKNAEPTGLEPATSAVTGQRSDQLS